jgi:hypothetical protein
LNITYVVHQFGHLLTQSNHIDFNISVLLEALLNCSLVIHFDFKSLIIEAKSHSSHIFNHFFGFTFSIVSFQPNLDVLFFANNQALFLLSVIFIHL